MGGQPLETTSLDGPFVMARPWTYRMSELMIERQKAQAHAKKLTTKQ
jgi:hypothetical protein